MSVHIEILFKEEVSGHSGYCSGEECELTTRVYKKQVQVEIGEITNNLEYYKKYADKVAHDEDNSNWCDLGESVVSAGLAAHEHRITIIRVSLVDMSKKRRQRRLKRDKKRLKMEQQRRAASRQSDDVDDD